MDREQLRAGEAMDEIPNLDNGRGRGPDVRPYQFNEDTDFWNLLKEMGMTSIFISTVRNSGISNIASIRLVPAFIQMYREYGVDGASHYRRGDTVRRHLILQILYGLLFPLREQFNMGGVFAWFRRRLISEWSHENVGNLFGGRLTQAEEARIEVIRTQLNNPNVPWIGDGGLVFPAAVFRDKLRLLGVQRVDGQAVPRYNRAAIPDSEFAAAMSAGNMAGVPRRVLQTAPVPRLPANFSSVGRLGTWDDRNGYTNFHTTIGGIPVASALPLPFQERVVAEEVNSIPSKPMSTLKTNAQFGDIVNQITEKIDTELYKKQEMLVSYKSRIIMSVFDALRNELKSKKVHTAPNKYVFSRFYNVYHLGKTFGQADLYPIHLKIKFDKDNNPIGDDPTDSGFGVYLGKLDQEDAPVYKMIPFGKKRRAEYEFKVAPYFGYVNSIFGVLKTMSPLGSANMVVHSYTREQDILPENAGDVGAVTRRELVLQTPGADITDNSKFSAWVGSAKDDNRPVVVAIRRFNTSIGNFITGIAYDDPYELVPVEQIDVIMGHCNTVVAAIRLAYANVEIDMAEFRSLFQGVQWIGLVPALHQAVSLIPQILVTYAPQPRDVVLERQIKVNDTQGQTRTFNTIGELSDYMVNRLQDGSNEIVDYVGGKGMNDCFMYIPHHRLTVRATDEALAATAGVDVNRITSHFRRRYEALHAQVMCSGFSSFAVFVQYIMLMGWIRNFIYSLKQERSKISKQRIAKYVKSDSKNLEKLIYTFGGEPSKFIGR